MSTGVGCRHVPELPCPGCAPGDCARATPAPAEGPDGLSAWLGAGVLVILLAALLLFLSCGAPVQGPELAEGPYFLTLQVRGAGTEGDCAWLVGTWDARTTVDARGQVASLLSGTTCSTSYEDGIEISCSGLGAKMAARGEIWPSLNGAQGAGTARGDVGGCREAVFLFTLAADHTDAGSAP